MIANIQGGVSMISELSTVIGFLSLVIVKILDFITPLDCLGYQKKIAGTETDWLLCPFCFAVINTVTQQNPIFAGLGINSLPMQENAPGTPYKMGCFALYRVIMARLFLIRSAACFRVTRFRQSGQYFAWLELDAKVAPHTVQRRISSVFNSSAYNSLSRGSTAV